MAPPSSSSTTPAHPVPRSAPAGTTRPPRLRRAVVGGALTTALLATGSLGLLAGIDALTAPSAAAQTASDTVPAADGRLAWAFVTYAPSEIKITSRAEDRADTRVVITAPNGRQLIINQPYGATPYITVSARGQRGGGLEEGATNKTYGDIETAEARLVWDQSTDTWQLTPLVSGQFIVQASASSGHTNSGRAPSPHVTLNGSQIDDSPIGLTSPTR